MSIDLDKLEQLALAAGGKEWHDDGTQIRAAGDDTCAGLVWWHDFEGDTKPEHRAHVCAANPAVLLELIALLRDRTKDIGHQFEQIETLQPQAEALHQVGHALGLLAGADLTVEVVPAVMALVRRLEAAEAGFKTFNNDTRKEFITISLETAEGEVLFRSQEAVSKVCIRSFKGNAREMFMARAGRAFDMLQAEISAKAGYHG